MLSIIQAVLIGMSVRYGGGVHQWNVRLKDFFKMLYVWLLAGLPSPPTLTPGIVGEHRDHHIQPDSLCHQTLHPHSISTRFRAQSQSEHEHVHRRLRGDRSYVYILFDQYDFQYLHLSPTGKILESADDHGLLLQRRRFDAIHWVVQCHL